MIVSLGFGLRIRSLDVLTSLRVEAVEAEGSPQVDVEDVEPWVRWLWKVPGILMGHGWNKGEISSRR